MLWKAQRVSPVQKAQLQTLSRRLALVLMVNCLRKLLLNFKRKKLRRVKRQEVPMEQPLLKTTNRKANQIIAVQRNHKQLLQLSCHL